MTFFEGGCLCGAVRYRSDHPPEEVGYCHCRMCQRSSGAPVSVWVAFPRETFNYTHGQPATFRSSDHGQREYCATCGSQLLFRDLGKRKYVDVNIGSLDDPESFKPVYHIWTESRISWFDTVDKLPRHGKES